MSSPLTQKLLQEREPPSVEGHDAVDGRGIGDPEHHAKKKMRKTAQKFKVTSLTWIAGHKSLSSTHIPVVGVVGRPRGRLHQRSMQLQQELRKHFCMLTQRLLPCCPLMQQTEMQKLAVGLQLACSFCMSLRGASLQGLNSEW